MSSSLTRLLVLAIALFLPGLAQAVAFTNGYYTGITATTPFVLTWSGDNTVRPAHLVKPLARTVDLY